MTPRSRKSAKDRKAEIVQTAIRLAALHGPDRVTTQHLADMVGVSQPAIFRHFPTKADIWLAVGETIAQRMTVEDMDTGDCDPVAVLTDLTSRYFGFIAQNPAIPAILFSRELHAENEKLRQHFEDVMTNRRAGFARLVARAIDTGQFRNDLSPDDAANLILATIQGVAMRWSLENRGFGLQTEGTRLIRTIIAGFVSRAI